MNQDSKSVTIIPPWIILIKEKSVVLVGILAILLCFTYLPTSVSRLFVQLGNTEFSVGNDNLGIVSYNLAQFLNSDLKEFIDNCYAFNAQQQYELAVNDCSKIVEIDPNYAPAYFYRGFAYLNLKYYDQAIADFTMDIEFIPIATRSYINRGSAYMEQGKYDLAIADFTKSIAINPKEPQAYLNRGLTYIKQSQYDLAIVDCNKAIELENKFWNAYSCVAVALAGKGEYESAITNFQNALTLAPSTKASYILCMQGTVYTEMGDFEAAFTSFEQGVKLDVANENDWCKSSLEKVREEIQTP